MCDLLTPIVARTPHDGDYTTRTLSARGPLGPCPFSNVTDCPSRSWSKRVSRHAELWKKYSLPSSARMKPKPLSLTRRLIVPFIDAAIPFPRENEKPSGKYMTSRCSAKGEIFWQATSAVG